MSTAIPKVYRGSVNRAVGWDLYSDEALTEPYFLPDDAVVVLTVSNGKASLIKRSDEDGLGLTVGDEETPARVSWTPTADESRMFPIGRAHVELEWWPPGSDDEIPLLLPDAAIDFVNGRNPDQ